MTYAETVLHLCDRFHALPSQVLAEDAELIQLINIEGYGKPQEGGEAGV